jgi:hypothetical protein
LWYHLATKGPHGEQPQLHCLYAEGDTDNGEAQIDTSDDISQPQQQTSEDEPDNITN